MSARIRWSDNDRYFGPFTCAKDGSSRWLALVLSSGRAEDCDWTDRGESTCTLRLSAFRRTLLIALPQIIQPSRTWVDTSKYEWSQGSKGYWQIDAREFGFSIFEGHLSVSYGRVTNDSSTEQRWGWFLPWRSWRHVRRSFYDLTGEHFATLPERNGMAKLGQAAWRNQRTVEEAIESACPTVAFEFDDFDGERLIATTRIEEWEWRLGEGKFKWLSLFRHPKIRRSLDLRFSGETGRRKGSWKGGTIGHSIDMLPGELHEDAFRRYCAEHGMTFAHPQSHIVEEGE